MRLLQLALLMILSHGLFGQDTINPQFKGGDKALYEFLGKNIIYPEKAKEQGLQGRVILNFIIETDGSVSNIFVLEGPGEILEQEAVKVVNLMQGMWTPGIINGEPVRVSFNMPIKFTLQIGGSYFDGSSYVTNPTISFFDTYKKGYEYLEKGMYKTASRYFSCYQVGDEINLDALYALGLCKFLLEDTKGAISCWEEAKKYGYEESKTKLTEAYFKIGNEYFNDKKYQIALTFFTKSLENTPTDINVLYNRGISYLYLGDKGKACEDWNNAKELGSSDVQPLIDEYCAN